MAPFEIAIAMFEANTRSNLNLPVTSGCNRQNADLLGP